MSPNPDFHDPAWRDLRALLRDAGYSTGAFRRALALEVSDEALLSDTGRYACRYGGGLADGTHGTHGTHDIHGTHDMHGADAAGVLGRLFLFSAHVPDSALGAVPRRLERLLWGLDLIEAVPGSRDAVKATVTLAEYQGMYFLADTLFEHRAGEILVREDELCRPLCASSLHLLHSMRTPPGAASILDVGCGSGCVSLLTGDRYRRIAGFDPFARAVDFARVNSVVNEVPADFTVDRWETFEAAHGYDCVLFDAPSAEAGLAFLTTAVDALLAPGGEAHVCIDGEVTSVLRSR